MAESRADIFARRLREERESSGINQTEFARRLSKRLGVKVYPTAITKIEAGTRAVKIDEAVAASEILGVALATLVTGQDSTENRLDQLRRELGRQQVRADEAQAEHQQATVAMAHIQQEIEQIEASRNG